MNDQDLRNILNHANTKPELRLAADFWADAKQRCQCPDSATNSAPTPSLHRLRRKAAFYSALASTTSIAACIAIFFSINQHPDVPRALDKFQLGSEFANNGAVVITDGPTDATILWVITEDEP